jgi:hypothetical protein
VRRVGAEQEKLMTRRTRITTLLARCLLAGSLLGCAAEVDTDGLGSTVDDASEVDVSSQALTSHVRRTFPRRGSLESTIVDSEVLAYGMLYRLTLRTGDLVDRLSADFYVPSQPDNLFRPGDPLVSRVIGGTAGGPKPSQNCDAGYAAVGLRGRAGKRLDALGLVCARIRSNGEPNLSDLQYLPVQGGPGGSAFFDLCQAGEWLGGMSAWAARKSSGTNDVVSAIQGVCYAAR